MGNLSTNKSLSIPTKTGLKQFLHFIEGHAKVIRDRAKVEPFERFEPTKFANQQGFIITKPDELTNLSDIYRDIVSNLNAKTWSGMGIPLENGKALIIMNPNQMHGRYNVTLMEEIAHLYYGHEPTKIDFKNFQRNYNEKAEKEAYWTASAVLLPAQAIKKAVWRNQAGGEIADYYGTSSELVEFRIKTLNMWSDYSKYQKKKEG